MTAPALADALTLEAFDKAFHCVRRPGTPGIDGVQLFAYRGGRRLAWLRDLVLRGSYRPGMLKEVDIPKRSGGVRRLRIPTLDDRIVQRVVLDVLQPWMDLRFDPRCVGFRPQVSRRMALTRLLAGVRISDPVLVQTDVRSLFDSLQIRLVADAAQAACDDPLWQDLTRRWTRAWPAWGDRGIPQGAPLSPLYANLALDRILDQPWPRELPAWIRFGDDLTAVVPGRHAARALLRWLTEALALHGLRLHTGKTHVHGLDDLRRHPATVLGMTVMAEGGRLMVQPAVRRGHRPASIQETRRGSDDERP